MKLTLAAIAFTVTLMVMAFCVFGFVATFEPPGWPALRAAYGVGVLAALGACALIVRWLWKG
jgi:hypothetical protein